MASSTRVSAGLPFPLGATWDGAGVNFALFSAHASRVELCLFDAEGRREIERIALPEFTHEVWHGYLPDAAPGPALRLPRPRPLRARDRPSLQPAQAAARPLRQGASPASCAGTTRSSATAIGSSTADLSFDRARQRAVHAECRSSTPPSPGATTGRRARRWRETVIYEAHVKGLTAAHPEHARARCAAPSRASASPQVVDHLRELGVTAVELMPVQAFFDDRHLVEQGLCQLLGLQHPRLLRAGRRATCCAGDDVAEFKTMVQRAARGRHRGHPRRRLQPHRRGQPSRPDAVASAASTTPATTVLGRRPALLLRLHRLPATRSTCATRACCRWSWTRCATGSRRCTSTASASTSRRRSAREPTTASTATRRFFDAIAPGPGAVAGQADRRALGPRARRLPGRQLPARLGRVERQVPRQRPRASGSGDAGAVGDFARRLPGSRRPLRPAAAGGPGRASTSSPRTTASPWHDLVSLQRASTTRPTARTTATATTTTGRWNCGVEGPTDDPAVLDLRDRHARATCWRRCSLSPGRADDPDGRRDRPHASAATTTPTARTTSSPGSTGAPSRASAAFLAFVAGALRLRRELALLAAPRWISRRGGRRGRSARGALAAARRHADAPAGLDQRPGEGARHPARRRRGRRGAGAVERLVRRCQASCSPIRPAKASGGCGSTAAAARSTRRRRRRRPAPSWRCRRAASAYSR